MEATLTIPRRIETIKKYQEGGGAVAAVLPIHYPRALMRAFDLLPVEVWGPPGIGAGQGAVHLQPYVCSIVHNALSFLQDGGLDLAEVLIVPHACDSLQGLGSILIDFVKPKQPVIPLYPPREKGASGVDFFAAELRAVYGRLEEITEKSPSDEDLHSCIQREEEADDLLTRLHSRRTNLPLSNLDYYRLIRSREYLPAETFSDLAHDALDLVESAEVEGIPILLSGIVPEPMDVLDALTELGAVVVGDDLASCGRRLYPPSDSDDPFVRMAERILFAPPDPTRGNPIQDRIDYLQALALATGAKGIIFYDVKFCEPELFDLPILRKELGEGGLPTAAIEVDINDPLSQQVTTRLGAFLEMIQ